MATITAGSSKTFTAQVDNSSFVVIAPGGSIGQVDDQNGNIQPIGPNGTRRTFGPLNELQSITVSMQIGNASVELNGWSGGIPITAETNSTGQTALDDASRAALQSSKFQPAGYLPKYLGHIADSTRLPTTTSLAAKQLICRSRYKLVGSGASFLQARFPNFAVVSNNGGLETGVGDAATITGYLVIGGTNSAGAITGGKAYQLTWSGATSVSVADKDMTPLHDPIYVSAPKNSYVWYQIAYDSPTGIVFEYGEANSEALDATNGEIFRFAASGLSLTQVSSMSTWTGGTSSTNYRYGACAVVTQTSAPSVLYVGTSIDMGFRSSANNGGNKGILSRSLAATCGFINVAQGGSSMKQWETLANRSLRMQLEQYCSHVITGHGINDLLESGAVDATEMTVRFATHLATFSKPVINCTCTARTTGTWNAADGSDQTAYNVSTFDARRAASNAAVRAGTTGYYGFFDVAAATCLPGSTDKKWYADGTTAYMFGPYATPDGLHPGTVGETYAYNSGVIDTSLCVSR